VITQPIVDVRDPKVASTRVYLATDNVQYLLRSVAFDLAVHLGFSNGLTRDDGITYRTAGKAREGVRTDGTGFTVIFARGEMRVEPAKTTLSHADVGHLIVAKLSGECDRVDEIGRFDATHGDFFSKALQLGGSFENAEAVRLYADLERQGSGSRTEDTLTDQYIERMRQIVWGTEL
jgi:hypothetical protein